MLHYNYSKLKSFSRRIMWLDASSSNNNPKIIAHYYMQCVKENEGMHA